MGNKDKRNFWKIPTFRQAFVIGGIISVMFSSGIGIGTATVMIPQLKKSKDDISVDDSIASWIYSVQGFASIPVVITLPYFNQWKGYRITIALNCIPMIVSYILQFFASSSIHLLLAAIFQGFTMGGNLCIGIMGITEYSEPRLRSLFLVLKSASYFWGIWIANIIGTFFYWRYISLFAIWPAIFCLFSCFLWPEGPYWLANKGRIEECESSFLWLRGPGNGTEELASIIKAQTLKKETRESGHLLTRAMKIVTLRHFYMPLFINGVLYCLYNSTGKLVFAVYALVIIKEITKNESAAYMGMLVIDAVTVVGMYVGTYVAMKVKRRSMLLVTSAVTILLLFILSIYLTLVDYKIIFENSILTLSLLVLYSFSVSWGPMVLCTSFTSELSPMRFKSFMVSAGSTIFYLLHSGSLKLAPVFFTNIGMHGTFGVYGALTLICWIYLYIYLPETSKKTLQELEAYFVNDGNLSDVKDENNPNESQNDDMLITKY